MFFYSPQGLVRDLVAQLKYHRQQEIGTWLGNWFGERFRDEPMLQSLDYVLPVPLHPRKQRRRGYNQCTEFGRGVARALGAQYSESVLIRTSHGRTQTRKGRQDRLRSAEGIFGLRDWRHVQGCRILLVDDVITTGATMEACGAALSEIPGTTLFAGAIAAVP